MSDFWIGFIVGVISLALFFIIIGYFVYQDAVYSARDWEERNYGNKKYKDL